MANLEVVEPSPAPTIGSLIHVGMAAHYGRRWSGLEADTSIRPDELAAPVDAVHVEATARGWTDFEPPAAATMKAYVELPADPFPGKVVAVEQVMKIGEDGELGISSVTKKPRLYSQRLDLAVESHDRKVWIVDHKCVPASCVVETRAGPQTVATILAADASVDLVAHQDGRLLYATPMPFEAAGMQDVYRLRTKSGRVASYGYKHPVLTRERGFVRVVDLRAGEHVAAALNLPDRLEVPISDALLQVVGALTCDGAMKHSSMRWSKKSAAKRARYVASVRAVGDEPRERHPVGRCAYVDLPSRGAVSHALDALGMGRVGSSEKRIPRACLAMSKRQVGVLVGALWEGDGAAYLVSGHALRIVYASRSAGLCDDVRTLLTQMGLVTTRTDSSVLYRGARRGYYFTTVVGRASKRQFLDMVEDGRIDAPSLTPHLSKLREAMESKRDAGHDPEIEGDVWWDPVESVLFSGKEPTFDVSVPGPETFVADGIVTHNSTSGDVVRASDTYTMSGQMIGYRVLGQRRWGSKFGGVMLNMVGVVRGSAPANSLKQRTIQVPPAPASDQTFLETVIGLDERKETMMLRYGTDGVASAFRYPQVLSDLVCYHRYGPCEFMPLCRFGKGMLGFYRQRERSASNPAPTASTTVEPAAVDSQTTTPVHGAYAVEPEPTDAPTDADSDVIDI